MEDIAKFLFSLSSADRLLLLRALAAKEGRLTQLARVLSASPQQTSKHLERLVAAGLVDRDPAGAYGLSPIGRSILGHLPAFELLARNRDYFLVHDLSSLPASFGERIGELSEGRRLDHAGQVVEHLKATMSGAREYAWILSDQPIVVGPSPGMAFSSRDLPVRLLSTPTVDRSILDDARSALPRAEFATLPEVRIALMVNERIAGVCFPRLEGKIDFGMGFVGTDPGFRAWCCDLFEYYWAQSRKTPPM